MRIGIVTPAPPGSTYGNRVTALRWEKILTTLGHTVSVTQAYGCEPLDLLIVLHARRGYASVTSFHNQHPDAPIVVALTGTDLYQDIRTSEDARRSLEVATRLIALQPEALNELPREFRGKTRVIHQSVESFAEIGAEVHPGENFNRVVFGP